MIIICDADEIIVNMMPQLLEEYNAKYQSDIEIEDVTQWQLPADMKEVYSEHHFFYDLKPVEGAIDGIKQLLAWGHDVVVATNHSNDEQIAKEKVEWFNRYLPEVAKNMMIGHRKDLLQGDVIIDDNADYLINSPCPIKICMDRPWNRDFMVRGKHALGESNIMLKWFGASDNFYSVTNWQQILDLFAGGACKIW